MTDENDRYVDGYADGQEAGYELGKDSARTNLEPLYQKAKKLVSMLDEAETHHGGLLTVEMLKAKNELRLELTRWK